MEITASVYTGDVVVLPIRADRPIVRGGTASDKFGVDRTTDCSRLRLYSYISGLVWRQLNGRGCGRRGCRDERVVRRSSPRLGSVDTTTPVTTSATAETPSSTWILIRAIAPPCNAITSSTSHPQRLLTVPPGNRAAMANLRTPGPATLNSRTRHIEEGGSQLSLGAAHRPTPGATTITELRT
jgi:hypothetical protein